MKVLHSLALLCFLAVCLIACSGNGEGEYLPLTVANDCEVALGDTITIPVTGGSGNLIVEGNEIVDASVSKPQIGNQKVIALIGRKLGNTNIVVRDKTMNESCNIHTQVIPPFLTLQFEDTEGKNLDILPNSLFVLIANKDSVCYVFSYSNAQFKYNDFPIMIGTYHISESGTALSLDVQGEVYKFKHTFKTNDNSISNLFNNMSNISTMPKATYTSSFTEVETGIELPHVFVSNKEVKVLPKISRGQFRAFFSQENFPYVLSTGGGQIAVDSICMLPNVSPISVMIKLVTF